MRISKVNIFLPILAFLLGSFAILIAVLDTMDNTFDFWIGYLIGPIFLFYAFKGNQGFLNTRWFKNYGKKFNE